MDVTEAAVLHVPPHGDTWKQSLQGRRVESKLEFSGSSGPRLNVATWQGRRCSSSVGMAACGSSPPARGHPTGRSPCSLKVYAAGCGKPQHSFAFPDNRFNAPPTRSLARAPIELPSRPPAPSTRATGREQSFSQLARATGIRRRRPPAAETALRRQALLSRGGETGADCAFVLALNHLELAEFRAELDIALMQALL